MDHTTLYILMLVAFCSTAHIPEENYSNTSLSDENIGDCMVDNVTYSNGAKVPSPGPCEECHCQSSEVVCAMIKCKPNTSGCKVIQQANHCCPQYKCECEFNGRLYNNGERLERPDDPCWVCYCKGGEVMCTSITCYERNDCTPHFVPGQCCPKYDHCPIENPHTLRSHGGNANSTNFSGKREMQPWLLTVSVNNQTSPSTANTETPSPNRYPQTIKIIEILPTQLPPLQKGGTKLTMGPMIPNKNDEDHVELLSAETPIDSQVNSDTTTPFVSRFGTSTLKEDKEEAENIEGNLSSTTSPDESDISTSDVRSNEDKIKENITDIIDESSTIINEVDRESITGINNVSETNGAQGHLTTISQSSTTEKQLTTQTGQQIELMNKEGEEASKVILHPLENKEFGNENEPSERSALYTDQRSDMNQKSPTLITNYRIFSAAYEDSSENSASIENTTSDVEEGHTPPSENTKTLTSGSDSEYKNSELMNKEGEEASKVILHPFENKEFDNENEPSERSALYTDQRSDMNQKFPTLITNYRIFSAAYEDSSENSASIENTTSDVEEGHTPPSEHTKTLTSESDSEYKNSELMNEEGEKASKVILHPFENKEFGDENEPSERSALYTDQRSDMNQKLPTLITNYRIFSAAYEDSSENSASIENATSDVEEGHTPPSENTKTFTSGSDSEYKNSEEDAVNTSGNSVFNSVSPTKYTMIPEYVLLGQMRDQESKSNDTFNRNNDVNLVNLAYTEYHDLSTKQNNDNVSPEIQPDSERYTTILPEKFDANLIEFNTENYYIDSTEGSGFDLISGWTYVDPTSEVYNELSHTSQAQISAGEFSSENVPLNEINSTPGMDEGNLNTSENLPIKDPNEVTTNSGSSESADQSTSNDETSSVSAEYMTDFNDNFKKTTIAFPSILKLNNQIQFLKIEDQQTTDGKENTPIAKIGIYNPKNPNNMANLVTVVKENNAELEQQINNDKVMTKEEENYTPHILLTPNDLKTLAEILIHEKIIPPFLQNEVRSTNIIEQRSIEQEIVTSETEIEATTFSNNEETTVASTVYEEEETNTLGNDTSYNDLVEIINVNNISSKANDELVIRETYSPKPTKNLTDLEIWAQNVLDKVTSNILVPLTGIEFVDSNTTTTESNFSKENVTTINDNSSDDNVTTSAESVEDFTESSITDITTETISESSTDRELNQSSEDSSEEHSGDSEIKLNEEKNNEEESEDKVKQAVQDVNTSRQSRIPSNLISPLLSTSMLDDRDLILLHNFFKKNLNSK